MVDSRPDWPEVMDLMTAANYLGIAPDTLHRYAIDGFMPGFKLGTRWRFRRSALERRMEQLEELEQAQAADRRARKEAH